MTPEKFQISRDSQALYITLVARNRLPFFKTDTIKNITCQALDEARNSGEFLIFAYVIMLDHLHLLTDQPKNLRRRVALYQRYYGTSSDRLSKGEKLPQVS